MRIVGGRLRGRALATPKSQAIRPTADRLREALFNILTHAYGDPIAGARVLDLFAGTGALGLEAVSRGAAFALFIDDGAEARALLRQNVEALGLAAVTRIFRRNATKLGPAHPVEPFSLAFLDPPYGKGLAERALASAREGGWLTNDALIVVEETVGAFKTPPEFEEIERRAYDDTEFAHSALFERRAGRYGTRHVKVGCRLVFTPEPPQRADRIRIAVDAQIDIGKRLAVNDDEAGRQQRPWLTTCRMACLKRADQPQGKRRVRLFLEGLDHRGGDRLRAHDVGDGDAVASVRLAALLPDVCSRITGGAPLIVDHRELPPFGPRRDRNRRIDGLLRVVSAPQPVEH